MNFGCECHIVDYLWSSFIENHDQIRFPHPQKSFVNLYKIPLIIGNWSSLTEKTQLEIFDKRSLDSDSSPGKPFVNLYKMLLTIGNWPSLIKKMQLEIFDKRFLDSDSSPSITLWSSFIEHTMIRFR